MSPSSVKHSSRLLLKLPSAAAWLLSAAPAAAVRTSHFHHAVALMLLPLLLIQTEHEECIGCASQRQALKRHMCMLPVCNCMHR
jgi:hypothetical protein